MNEKKFWEMHEALKRIAKDFASPSQLRRSSANVGLDYEESLEFAYENIQVLAKAAIKGVRKLK